MIVRTLFVDNAAIPAVGHTVIVKDAATGEMEDGGAPVAGSPGPPGEPGAAGPPGADGAQGSPGMVTPWVTWASGDTAAANDRILADTSGGGWTLTLPGAPGVGDTVTVLDKFKSWTTNNLTIARNGNLIEGQSENLTLDVSGPCVDFVWVGSSTGWRVIIHP